MCSANINHIILYKYYYARVPTLVRSDFRLEKSVDDPRADEPQSTKIIIGAALFWRLCNGLFWSRGRGPGPVQFGIHSVERAHASER